MVSPNVALACASAGAVLVTIAFTLGIAFMTSTQFATAGLQCNPDVLTSTAAQTTAEGFCTEDMEVTDADGNVCQIANLGLFSAAYTPECTQKDATNPYALSSLLEPESGAPGDITVIFPSQTGLGSLPEALGLPALPEFKDCKSYFAGATGASGTNIVSQLTTVAGTGAIVTGLASFQAQTKAAYDQGLVDNLNNLELNAFTNAAGVLVTLIAGAMENVLDEAPGFTYSDTFAMLGGGNWPAAGSFSVGGAPLGTTVSLLIEAGRVILPTEENVVTLAATALAAERGADTGFPSDGLWGAFDSPTICNNLVALDCTGKQFVESLSGILTFLNTSETLASAAGLDQALQLFDGYLFGANAAGMTAFTDLDIANAIAVPDPTTVTTFSMDTIRTFYQNLYDPSAAVGSSTGFPEFPGAAMTSDGNQAFGIICQGAQQASDCSTIDLLTATATGLALAGDTDGATTVGGLLLIAAGCATDGWNNCTLTENGAAYTNPAFRVGVLLNVFGSLYSLEAGTPPLDEDGLVAAIIASCEDHVKNLSAIELLQILAPLGTALIGLGALILVANLLVRNDNVKKIGIAGGLLCLLGTILVIAGFLTLQGAPIYASLGAEPEDPPSDNSTTFALGGAYTIVLVFLGGAVVGSIVSIIGSALLSPKGESSTDILGKA